MIFGSHLTRIIVHPTFSSGIEIYLCDRQWKGVRLPVNTLIIFYFLKGKKGKGTLDCIKEH